MNLPFFWLASGWIAGILAARLTEISFRFCWAVLVCGLPFLWCSRGRRIFLLLFVFLTAVISALYFQLRYDEQDTAVRSWAQAGVLRLEGVVRSAPRLQITGKKRKVSFILSATNLTVRRKGRTEYYATQGKVQVFLFQPSVVPEYGDRVRLFGTLERPFPALNPGNFDYRDYLEQRGMAVIFQGYGGRSIRLIRAGNPLDFFRIANRIRSAIGRRLELFFAPEAANLFKALIIGERKDVDPQLNEDFVKTGTSHLLAISGLNIALLIGSLYGAAIAFRIPQKPAAFLGLCFTAAYVIVAGADAPVVRAGWMTGAGLTALLLEREKNSINTFFLAVFLILTAEPKSLTFVSFQLSFISVFALIVLFRLLPGHWGRAAAFFQTFAASIGTFPVVVYYFHIFSPVSFFANVLAIPLFHLALLTAFGTLLLSWVPGLNAWIAMAAQGGLNCGIAWIRFCASFPYGYFYLPEPAVFQIVLYYLLLGSWIGLSLSASRKQVWLKSAVLSVLLLTALSFFWKRHEPGFSLTILAAGRNEVMHLNLEEERRHILINTGRCFPKNQADWVIGPYLRSQGIKKLDAVILTDWAKKHTGGLETLRRNFVWDRLWYPAPSGKDFLARELAASNRSKSETLRAGMRIPLGLHGEIGVLDIVAGRMIGLISYGDRKVLLLPPLGSDVAASLRKNSAWLKNIDLLVVPSLRHDEKRLFEKLFDEVDPGMVVMSHINDEEDHFLNERDIPVLTTEKYGSLNFKISGNSIDAGGSNKTAFRISSYLRGPIGG